MVHHSSGRKKSKKGSRVRIGCVCEKHTCLKNNLKERRKGGKHTDIWGKSIPGGGNSMCKGPEVGACLVHAKNSEEVSVAEMEWAGRRSEEKTSDHH